MHGIRDEFDEQERSDGPDTRRKELFMPLNDPSFWNYGGDKCGDDQLFQNGH